MTLSAVSVVNEDEPPDLSWKNLLRGSIESPLEISARFNLPVSEIEKVCKKYPARINPYYISLIRKKGDAIYKQCVPSIEELNDQSGYEDPLHEEVEHQERKNVPPLITYRYPDRILFRISNQCAMYCRFCTRKRKVGDESKQPRQFEIKQGMKYIESHLEIRDVILSGGDPLMLDDSPLEKIIRDVHGILSNRKNSIIRIGTRIPCSLPQRITSELCNMLKKYHPLYINTHFNHPDEITSESERACSMLADSGIPLGCQTVLLKGVNDNSETMKELMRGLVAIRVKPYYIYQADPVLGTNHFRAPVAKGIEIIESLRGHTSGLCVPAFVIDAPGGGGKIPLLPEYVLKITDKEVVMRNYLGKIFTYKQTED